MEKNEISIHEVRAFRFFTEVTGSDPDKWITSQELSVGADVAPRTARAFCKKFSDLGIVDLAEVYPSHRYRLSSKASKRNAAYVARLERAVGVFGLKGSSDDSCNS